MRFYEDEFEIHVPRNKSNHRYYTYKEIEKFLYIKSLKERGLSNNQIKEILKSPEIIMENDEIAVTLNNEQITLENHLLPVNQLNNTYIPNEIQINELKNIIETKIDNNFNDLSKALMDNINKVLEENLSKKREIGNEDKDTLISENARLKMRLKEKAYETAQLREKVKKTENSRVNFFSKFFNLNKKKT